MISAVLVAHLSCVWTSVIVQLLDDPVLYTIHHVNTADVQIKMSHSKAFLPTWAQNTLAEDYFLGRLVVVQ